MRKISCLLLCIMLILSMTACNVNLFPHLTGGNEQPAPAINPTNAATEPSEEFEVTEAPETVPPTEAPESASKFPYLQRIDNHDELIFDTPTYDGRFVDTVRVKGTYTIVEEKVDDEGNLWGKLKSGAGWVNLNSVKENNAADLPISGAELTYTPTEEDLREYGTKQDYTTPVIIHCYDQIDYVRIYRMTHDGMNLVQDELLYTIPELLPEWPLVVHFEFTGSMSIFGISFLDVNGVEHHYSIQQNGRNNATHLIPYTP